MENHEVKKTSGLSVAGFITSLLSMILGGALWIVSLPLSIAGTVSASRNRKSGKGLGIAGIIISAFCIIEFAVVILLTGILGSSLSEYSTKAAEAKTMKKDFGSYRISRTWVEAKKNGPSDALYCSRDRRKEKQPNNIEVRCDSYKYSEDDVMEFKESLQAQMYMQAPEGATVTGSGFQTDKGYNAFVYTFISEKEGLSCSQYYIMGDKEFVMISAMIWNAEEDETDKTIDCAETIVNSFEWE